MNRSNAASTLVHRLQRWPNTKKTPVQLNVPTAQQTQNICTTFVQRRPNVFDAGPTLYKCYTNALCFLGGQLASYSNISITIRYKTARQPWHNAGPAPQTVAQHYPTVGSPPHARWTP